MNSSKAVAFSGMFAALQLVLLFLGSTMWVLCYSAPLFCGLVMIILKESAGVKYCVLSYIASSIIGILFLPDKECVLTYVFFFGYYTIIRDYLNKPAKWLSYVLKFLLYNASIGLSQLMLIYVFHIPFDNELGKLGIPLLIFGFNFVFVFYELLFPRLTKLYYVKYKSRVDKMLK
ncbi:MAG: hypothetical protein IKF64_05485 [Eubacterium sp.]|nr:hypothetical protein [Eubacterium sp.]